MCPNPQSIQRFSDRIRHYIYFVNYSNKFFFFIRRPREQANHRKLETETEVEVEMEVEVEAGMEVGKEVETQVEADPDRHVP